MEFVVSTLIASRTVDFISKYFGTSEAGYAGQPRTLDYKQSAIT